MTFNKHWCGSLEREWKVNRRDSVCAARENITVCVCECECVRYVRYVFVTVCPVGTRQRLFYRVWLTADEHNRLLFH